MSARNQYYMMFPTAYYDELIDAGERKKAAALVEYFRDMERGRVYSFAEYAAYWFDDRMKKGTAFKWIEKFKEQIELFFAHWQLKNEQHFLDAKTGRKPFGNPLETVDPSQSPKNRGVSEDVETPRKREGNISNKVINNTHSRKRKRYDYEREDAEVARHLFDKLLAINPDRKKSNLEQWADDARKMRVVDGRESKKIRNMIDLIFDENPWFDGTFWRGNIQSIAKLRKQYDTIADQIRTRGRVRA